ncbi:MAG: NHLP family bacteriocin export ABC transporter peptidase/permease/ATPase subunit [Planctomycetaceae bacterium]|jgi:NHLM bacteriocin system ABC transporter peptidase/ATP-binding protein|nr:NHLP family bacteriocin export ABC transporter peptidase/permease/ATPase subunit [Planctomycetaceae bacterium]
MIRLPFFHRRRTPTFIQMEQTECGAVALGIVLASLGRWVPIEELRTLCGINRDGSNLLNIIRAGKHFGLNCEAFRKSLNDVKKINQLGILFWGFNHFVVYEGYYGGHFYINDPAAGPRILSEKEFSQSYTGIFVTAQKTDSFVRGGHRPSTASWLLGRLQHSKSIFFFIFTAALILVFPTLCTAVCNKIFYDDILVDSSFWLRPFLTFFLVIILFQGIFTWIQGFSTEKLRTKLSITASAEFFWHCLQLSITFFSNRHAGDLSVRVQENNIVAQLLSSKLTTNLLNFFLIGIYGILMLLFNPILTLIAVAAIVFNAVIVAWIRRYRIDLNKRLVQESAQQTAVAVGGIQIIETFKSSGQEDLFFTRWADSQVKTVNSSQRLQKYSAAIETLPPLLSSITNAALFCFGGLQVMNGKMTFGDLIAFQSLMLYFMAPVNGLTSLTGDLQSIQANIGRLNDVLNNERDPLLIEQKKTGEHLIRFKSDSAQSDTSIRLKGKIELRNISFGYNPLARPLIEDFSLLIEPGKRVALVGASGSGKTTVARLISGLFRPAKGEILFDDIPMREIPRIVLAQSIAMVNQDIVLFEGTIRDNLTMWNPAIDDRDLAAATKDAAIYEAITQRLGSFDAVVEQLGHNFSGGQRQRLEIARALAGNPSILIMDEATNSLDTITEKIIDTNIRKRNITMVISAHRLSTIRDCDEIIVFSEGIVVERGRHEELMKNGRFYTKLIQSE